MMIRWTLPLLLVVSLSACASPTHRSSTGSVEGKKLIKLYGIDKPSTSYLKENIAEIERTPLDGICVMVMTDEPKPEDRNRKSGNYLWFGPTPLTREDFRQNVRDLNDTKFQRLDFNFLYYAARGQNTGWFDDEGWRQLIENAKVAAWVIQQTPLVGMTFDCEYSGGGLWNYANLVSNGGPDFETYSAKVRERGRSWATVICEVVPDVIICLSHGYWLASPDTEWHGAHQPRRSSDALADQPYALYPAFLDGVLEGLGPKATIVDGCEQTYPYMVYETFLQFREWAQRENRRLSTVSELVDTRMTYAMATWPGFRSDVAGMWNSDTPESNFFTPTNLSHALHNAMAASDRFAWVFSGRDLWWPRSVPPMKIGERMSWGALQMYPDVYREAMAKSRLAKDLSWRPTTPDMTVYDPPSPRTLQDETFEVLFDLPETWWFKTEPDNVLYEYAHVYSGWTNNARPNLAERENHWQQIRIDDYWERQGVSCDGVAWYRVRVTPPPTVQGRQLWLAFGGIEGAAHVHAAPEGHEMRLLGTNDAGEPFMINATGAFLPGKTTLIAIRVINPGGPGGIHSYVTLVGKPDDVAYIPKPGKHAVLDLDFNAMKGERVPDRSGFENHAYLSACTAVDLPTGGRAVRLDGRTSSVRVAPHPSLNPWQGEQTYELSYSPGGAVAVDPIYYHMLLTKNTTYGDGLYLVQNVSPPRIAFQQGGPNQSIEYEIPDVNAWYEIAATYDGESMRLYVNGGLVGSRKAPIPPTINSADVLIGGGAIDTNRCAPGLVRRAAIYNYALTSQAIMERHGQR